MINNSKGSVLVYVLVLTIVIATVLTGLMNFFLSSATQQKKYSNTVNFQNLLDEARSKVTNCLMKSSYPNITDNPNCGEPTEEQWKGAGTVSCKPTSVGSPSDSYPIKNIIFAKGTPPICPMTIEIDEKYSY